MATHSLFSDMTMASPASQPSFATPQLQQPQQQQQQQQQQFEGEQFSKLPRGSLFRVGARSQVKRVAGTIAHTARGSGGTGDVCTLAAAGDVAINQAIKSIAIASQYLIDDGLRCAVQPSFDPHGAMILRIVCHTTDELKDVSVEESEHKVMRVAGGSDAYKVAGAVAQSVRKHATSDPFPFAAQLAAQGAGAVALAVRALVYSRGYTVGDGTDIMFIPAFTHVKTGEQLERSIMMLNIFKSEVACQAPPVA